MSSTGPSTSELNALMDTIEFDLRSKPVDYNEMKKEALRLLGKDFSIAWGISLCLESLKKWDGRYVKVGGTVMTYEALLTQLDTQGSKSLTEGRSDPSQRINTGKDILTVGRLARAFSPMAVKFVMKFPAKNPFVLKFRPYVSLKDLPDHYMFLEAPYAMSNEELEKYKGGLYTFYEEFDKVIATAVANGWQKNEKGETITGAKGSQRIWRDQFANFLQFRGLAP
jgi:hypothetical protein